MKSFLLIAIALWGFAAGAAQIEDGIYWLAKPGEGQKVKSPNGADIYVGKKFETKPLRATLLSQNNANTEFYLSLDFPFIRELNDTPLVVVVAQTAFRQSSGGSNENKQSFSGFNVSGRTNTVAVAALFETKPAARSHPGHQLRVEFVPDKEVYAPGEAVAVTMKIENVGDKAVAWQKGGHNRAQRDTQYRFSGFRNGEKQLADVGNDMNFGGLSVLKTLQPGEVFEEKIDLAKWFSFSEESSYEILGSYLMEFYEPPVDGAQKRSSMLWQDFVTSEFSLRVEKTAEKETEKKKQ